ncbi:MAG: tetratricopeptide repeat protein [Acidobacteriota bacterium]|nr:tetratricopeptide repeat protein [Acidobacteriota bacterium]
MEPVYDVFISYAHKDREPVRALVPAFSSEGLRVFIDETGIEAFGSIQRRVEQGIARSKVLLAWYSINYAKSRPCQWELAAGYVCGSGERVLVVNPEQRTDHIQPRSLLDRLFAAASDPGQLARDVKRRVAEFSDTLGETFSLKQPRPFGFQPAGSNRFVGRAPELWAIDDALKRSANPMLSGVVRSIVQVRGLGGIGKSLLAEEYALRFGAAFPGGVFWLRALGGDNNKSVQDREADRMQQITEFAAQIPLPVENKRFPEIWAMLAEELPKRDCLWIVDDVPSGLTREQLSNWYSPHPAIPTLITIPDLSHDDLGIKVDLDALTQDQALDLLRGHKLNDGDGDGAASLVEALDRHPLAIEIAASYLEFRNGAVSCADFVEQLRTSTRDQLEFAAKIKHAPGLVTALSATMAQLSAPATDLLVLASVLASAAIPADLIDAALAQIYRCSLDEAQLMRLEATAETDRFALSRFDPVRPEARRVHALVSRTARLHAATPERVAKLRAAAVAALSDALQAMTYAKFFRLGLESIHARELSANPGTGDEAALLVLVGAFDLMRGDLVSAERLGHRALDYCTATLDADHDYANRAKGLLGLVLLYRGGYTGARSIFEPVVAAAEKRLPPGNLYRLGAQLALASVLSAQGELDGSRRMAETAVAESVQANGTDHPLTLTSKTILSQIMALQGNNVQAVELMNQVLAGRRRQAVEGDTDLLFEEFSMIKARGAGSDFRDAEPVVAKAVDVFTNEFGSENALTLQARFYQMCIALQQGRISEAQRQSSDLITTMDRVFGPMHPLTLQARIFQAQSLLLEDRYDEAKAQIEPLIGLFEKALSSHHPEVIATKLSLATAVLETRDWQRAYGMLQDLVKESETHLGREHANSIGSRCALVSCLGQIGRLNEAQAAWNELIEIPGSRTNLSTFNCGNNLASALADRKDVANAQTVLLKIVSIAGDQLGGENPAVVTAKMRLAMNADALGQLTEAAQWWEQVVAAQDRALGNAHPNTTSAAWSLFLVRLRMGQFQECYQVFQKRFLWFCKIDSQTLDSTQREIFSFIQKTTPWLAT